MAIEKKPQIARHGIEVGGPGVVASPGTSAQRDAGAKNGTLRFNTTEKALEVKDGASWNKMVGLSSVINNVTTDGATLVLNAINTIAIGATGSVLLPTTAGFGDKVVMFDLDGEFNTFNLTVDPGAQKLNGVIATKTYKTDESCLVFTYYPGYGWAEVNAMGGGSASNYDTQRSALLDDEVADVNSIQLIESANGITDLKLPASPSIGDRVMYIDVDGEFDTRNLVVDTNGNDVNGNGGDYLLSRKDDRAEFIYLGSSGWRVTHSNEAKLSTVVHTGSGGVYTVTLNSYNVFAIAANTDFSTTLPTGAVEGDEVQVVLTKVSCLGIGDMRVSKPAGVSIDDHDDDFYITKPHSNVLFRFTNGEWKTFSSAEVTFDVGPVSLDHNNFRSSGQYQGTATADMPFGIPTGQRVYMSVYKPNDYSRNEVNVSAGQQMKQVAFFPAQSRTFERVVGTTSGEWGQITPIAHQTTTDTTLTAEANSFYYLDHADPFAVTLPAGVIGDKVSLKMRDNPGAITVSSSDDIEGAVTDFTVNVLTKVIHFEHLGALGWVVAGEVRDMVDASIGFVSVTTDANLTMESNNHYVVDVDKDAFFTLTAPAAPIEGETIIVSLIGESCLLGSVVLAGGGKEIDGSLFPIKLQRPNITVQLRFANDSWITVSQHTAAVGRTNSVDLDSVDFARDGKHYVTVATNMPEGVPVGTDVLIETESLNSYDSTWYSATISRRVIRQTITMPSLRRKLVRSITDADGTTGLVTAEPWGNIAQMTHGESTSNGLGVNANTITRLTASPVEVQLQKGVIGDKVTLIYADGVTGASLKYTADPIMGGTVDYDLPDGVMSVDLEYVGADGWVMTNLSMSPGSGSAGITFVEHTTTTAATLGANTHNIVDIGANESLFLTMPTGVEDATEIFISLINDTAVGRSVFLSAAVDGFAGNTGNINMSTPDATLHARFVKDTWQIVSNGPSRRTKALNVDMNGIGHAKSGTFHVTVSANRPYGIADGAEAWVTNELVTDFNGSLYTVNSNSPISQKVYFPETKRLYQRTVTALNASSGLVSGGEWANITPIVSNEVALNGFGVVPNTATRLTATNVTATIGEGAVGDKVSFYIPTNATTVNIRGTGDDVNGEAVQYVVPDGITYVAFELVEGLGWVLINATDPNAGGAPFINVEVTAATVVEVAGNTNVSINTAAAVVPYLRFLAGNDGDIINVTCIGDSLSDNVALRIAPGTGVQLNGAFGSLYAYGRKSTLTFRCIGTHWVSVSHETPRQDAGVLDIDDASLLKPGRHTARIGAGIPAGVFANSKAWVTTEVDNVFNEGSIELSSGTTAKQTFYFPAVKRTYERHHTGSTAYAFGQVTPIIPNQAGADQATRTLKENTRHIITYDTAAERKLPSNACEGDRVIIHPRAIPGSSLTVKPNPVTVEIDGVAADFVVDPTWKAIEFVYSSAVSGWVVSSNYSAGGGQVELTVHDITGTDITLEANSVNKLSRAAGDDTTLHLPDAEQGATVDLIFVGDTNTAGGELKIRSESFRAINGVNSALLYFQDVSGTLSFRCVGNNEWISTNLDDRGGHLGDVDLMSAAAVVPGEHALNVTAGAPDGITMPTTAQMVTDSTSKMFGGSMSATSNRRPLQRVDFPLQKRRFERYLSSAAGSDEFIQTTPLVRLAANQGSSVLQVEANTWEQVGATNATRTLPDVCVQGDRVVFYKAGKTVTVAQGTGGEFINRIDADFVAEAWVETLELTYTLSSGWLITKMTGEAPTARLVPDQDGADLAFFQVKSNIRHYVTRDTLSRRKLPGFPEDGDRIVFHPRDIAGSSLVVERGFSSHKIDHVSVNYTVDSGTKAIEFVYSAAAGSWLLGSNFSSGGGGGTTGPLEINTISSADGTLEAGKLNTFSDTDDTTVRTLTLPAQAGLAAGDTVKVEFGDDAALNKKETKIVSPDANLLGTGKTLVLRGVYSFVELLYTGTIWEPMALNRGFLPNELRSTDADELKLPGKVYSTVSDGPMPTAAANPAAYTVVGANSHDPASSDTSFTQHIDFVEDERSFVRYGGSGTLTGWGQLTPLRPNTAVVGPTNTTLKPNEHFISVANSDYYVNMPADPWEGDRIRITSSSVSNITLSIKPNGSQLLDNINEDFLIIRGRHTVEFVWENTLGWILVSDNAPRVIRGTVEHSNSATMVVNRVNHFKYNFAAVFTATMPAPADCTDGDELVITMKGTYAEMNENPIDNNGNNINGSSSTQLYLTGNTAHYHMIYNDGGWSVISSNQPVRDKTTFGVGGASSWLGAAGRMKGSMTSRLPGGLPTNAKFVSENTNAYSFSGVPDTEDQLVTVTFPEHRRVFTKWRDPNNNLFAPWAQATPMSRENQSQGNSTAVLNPNRHYVSTRNGTTTLSMPTDPVIGDKVRFTSHPNANKVTINCAPGDTFRDGSTTLVTTIANRTLEFEWDTDTGWVKTIDTHPSRFVGYVEGLNSQQLKTNTHHFYNVNAAGDIVLSLPVAADCTDGDELIVTPIGVFGDAVISFLRPTGTRLNGDTDDFRIRGKNRSIRLRYTAATPNLTGWWVVGRDSLRTDFEGRGDSQRTKYGDRVRVNINDASNLPAGMTVPQIALFEVNNEQSYSDKEVSANGIQDIYFPDTGRKFMARYSGGSFYSWSQVSGLRPSNQPVDNQVQTLRYNESIYVKGTFQQYPSYRRDLPAVGASVFGDMVRVYPKPQVAGDAPLLTIGANGNVITGHAGDYVVPVGVTCIELTFTEDLEWAITSQVSKRLMSEVMVVNAGGPDLISVNANNTIIEFSGALTRTIDIDPALLVPGDTITLNANDTVNISIGGADMIAEDGTVTTAPNTFAGRGKLNMYVNSNQQLVYMSAVVL